MFVLLFSVRWQFTPTSLDDIDVFSKPLLGHIGQVKRVLQLVYDASVTRMMKKCNFSAETFDGQANLFGRAVSNFYNMKQKQWWNLKTQLRKRNRALFYACAIFSDSP